MTTIGETETVVDPGNCTKTVLRDLLNAVYDDWEACEDPALRSVLEHTLNLLEGYGVNMDTDPGASLSDCIDYLEKRLPEHMANAEAKS